MLRNEQPVTFSGRFFVHPGAGLDAWPSRTRWAQTIISKVPRQVARGTPEPLGWLVARFPRLGAKGMVLMRFEALVRYFDMGAPTRVATHGEVWSPLEDGAWAPRPPPGFVSVREDK